MSPGKARLWTGIGCVGTLVTIAAAMLAGDAPNSVFATAPGDTISEYVAILVVFIVAAGVLLPFDLIGGVLIPTKCESQGLKFSLWLRLWIRSVGFQTIFYSVIFFLHLKIGREVGAPCLIAMFAAIQIALLASQELICRSMTGQRLSCRKEGHVFRPIRAHQAGG